MNRPDEERKRGKSADSFPLWDRFRYWFDNRMSKGSLWMIHVLIIASLVLAVLSGLLIALLGFNEDGEIFSVIWDSIATIINAWMPYFADGSPGYLLLMSVTAIAGVLFTSVLIGIVTSAIEEKIDSLKRGNSIVLERDHIVVLGFYPGEYTLLEQLILAAAGKPACVVIAEDLDRGEMEQAIDENLDVPKNFRIVCRTADITDPASLEKCSVETCRTVIVSPTDDLKTIKVVLAVSALLEEKGVPEISVNAIISKDEYRFPPSIAEVNHIATLQTNTILAKMIAHSCTQVGLSEAFREIFNFEGSEFYLTKLPGLVGLKFEEIMLRVTNGVPSGIFRNGRVLLNPPADERFGEDDLLLVFSQESDSARLLGEAPDAEEIRASELKSETHAGVVVIGYNEALPVLLEELPENVSNVRLVCRGIDEESRAELLEIAAQRGMEIDWCARDPRAPRVLTEIARSAEHVVVLSDHERDAEQADMDTIFLLLNLRDLRQRFDLGFNITVEMRLEHNQRLVSHGEHIDFLVSSSMSSLILAQLAENPELIGVFREILSNEGNELYLKSVRQMQIAGAYPVSALRRMMLSRGYILLGYLDARQRSRFDLALDEVLTLTEEDNLIVLGLN